MLELECPICKRVITCDIDEIEGGFQSFTEAVKFLDNAQRHLQKHSMDELLIWFRDRLLVQVKAKLGLTLEPIPLTQDERMRFLESAHAKGLTEEQIMAEAIRVYLKTESKQ